MSGEKGFEKSQVGLNILAVRTDVSRVVHYRIASVRVV